MIDDPTKKMAPTCRSGPAPSVGSSIIDENVVAARGGVKSVSAQFNPQISICADATSTATTTTTLREVLQDIRSDQHRKQVDHIREKVAALKAIADEDELKAAQAKIGELKKGLPSILFSGVFSKRSKFSRTQASGVLCVDIDAKGNEAVLQRAETRSRIEDDPYTLAAFTSPSGTGIKVLVRIPTPCDHLDAFEAAREHFRTWVNLKLDVACSDTSRICFTSFDPHLFARDDAPVLPVKFSQPAGAVVQNLHSQAQPPTVLNDFKARGDPLPILIKHGWSVFAEKTDGSLELTRPGKDKGCSATWNFDGRRTLCVFSSNAAPFEVSPSTYSASAIYAMLECGGDFTRAAAELRDLGFGPDSAVPLLTPLVPAMPFTLWSPSQCLAYQPPVGSILLDNGYLVRGEMTSFLGIGGLGKTRMALWLAVCQILGRDWCDLPTHGAGVTWLFLSTESGLSRWKNDLSLMMGGLSKGDQSRVEAHLWVLALVPGEDGYINFGSPESNARLAATLQQVKPAVIVLDPLADMIDGDENATADVVKTLRGLRSIHKIHAPDAAILIIHHSRTGVQNVIQAGDNFSSGNFGRGSKALYSKVRCELQLAPGDRDDPTKLVLGCGKANDCAKFAPRGVIFDPQTCTYSGDPSFDVQAWRDDLNGKRRSQLVSVVDVICAVRDTISAGGAGTTEVSTAAIVATLQRSVPASGKTVIRRLNESLPKGYILKGSVRGLWTLGPKANLIP